MSFYVIFDEEVYTSDELRESYFEIGELVLKKLKMKQIGALEDLDQTDTEPELNAYVETLVLN